MMSRTSRFYISIDILRLIITSFCITILSLYFMQIRGSITDYIDFSKILLDSDYQSKTFITYDDLFTSLESDIEAPQETLEEIDEAHQHSDEIDEAHQYSDEINEKLTQNNAVTTDNTIVNIQRIIIDEKQFNYNKNITISLDNIHKTADADTVQENVIENSITVHDTIESDKKEEPLLTENNNSINVNNTPWETKSSDNANRYILPIADALEHNIKAITGSHDSVKNEVAFLYKKRQEMTLTARKLQLEISKDIIQLKSIFKALGVPISQRFLNLKTDISKSRVLKQLKLTSEELDWRYPELTKSLKDFYKLRVFASFLPLGEPVFNARRSSPFGYRHDPFTKRQKMHMGLDFATKTGTPLISSGVGIIKFAGFKSGYGNTIDIYHGDGVMSRYAHLSRISVVKGQHVATGQRIGATGSTGRSTGPHLHYEIRLYNKPVNPNIFIAKKEYIKNIINKN